MDPVIIFIHPTVPTRGVLGPLPSCSRGSWGCGTSLGSIPIMILMSYSRTPHPQVVAEALAAFRRQDLHRIHRWEAPLETETGSSKTRNFSKKIRSRILFRGASAAFRTTASGGRSGTSPASGGLPEPRQRPVDVVCDSTTSKT